MYASAGDILVFGLKSEQKEKLVFYYQCKWTEQQDGLVYYSQIEKEMKKNQTLQIGNSKQNRNITIIICGPMISELPETLPNDLIINQFFGILSDAIKSHCTQQFIRINKLDVKGLQKIPGIEEEFAKIIFERRGKEGFSSLEDVKTKLDTTAYNTMTKNHKARTILF